MPHLNSLRAFEAAARHNSISAGANELHVTPAAVAQQIKALEGWTGKQLFKRNAKGVELTSLGAGVLDEFGQAFDALAGAVQKLRISANPKDVRIAALPSIAQLWVSPRLPEIRRAMPEVSISVTAMETPPNLKRDLFDLSIFYEEHPVKINAMMIEKDSITPVCSPSVAAGIRDVSDLKREVFLHDSIWKDDWSIWLSVASPDQNLNKAGPEFSLYSLALEECKNGAGVLMGHEALVRPYLEAGTLVAPFSIKVDLPQFMTFKSRPQNSNDEAFNQVMQMLKSPHPTPREN